MLRPLVAYAYDPINKKKYSSLQFMELLSLMIVLLVQHGRQEESAVVGGDLRTGRQVRVPKLRPRSRRTQPR